MKVEWKKFRPLGLDAPPVLRHDLILEGLKLFFQTLMQHFITMITQMTNLRAMQLSFE